MTKKLEPYVDVQDKRSLKLYHPTIFSCSFKNECTIQFRYSRSYSVIDTVLRLIALQCSVHN